MPRADNSGVEIEYETFGDRRDQPLLLIMGFTTQMTAWDVGFCHALAERGHLVIRFDNRDVGLSTRSPKPAPNILSLMTAAAAGPLTVKVPYTLSDMGGDALAVLDDLGLDQAHVLGASMGGMIAQTLAIEYGARLTTLTIMMSTTGAPDVGQASPEALTALLAPPPGDRAGAIARSVATRRAISGPLFDEAKAEAMATAAYDRSFHPEGGAFQLAAILESGDRTSRLRTVTVPTLVLHGKLDPLIDVSGGRALAATIPGARLHTIPQMGHDLPEPLWPEMVDAIAGHTNAGRDRSGDGGAHHVGKGSAVGR